MRDNSFEKYVFFDLDGTLADSIPAMRRIYHLFLERHGAVGSEKEFQDMNGFVLSRIVSTIRRAHGLTQEYDMLFLEYNMLIEERYGLEASLMSGAKDVLCWLRDKGVGMKIVTSAPRSLAKSFLDTHDVYFFFDEIISGEDVVVSKPDPEIYRLAAKNVRRGKALVVEDSPNGVRSAKGAGLVAIGFGGEGSRKELEAAGADYVIGTLGEIPELLEMLL